MGGLDILINNAGIGVGTKEAVYDVNVVSTETILVIPYIQSNDMW